MTFRTNHTQHNTLYAIMLRVVMLVMLSVVMLSVVMLSVVMLSVFMVSVFMVSVFMLSVFMLSVFMLNAIRLNVVAPFFSASSVLSNRWPLPNLSQSFYLLVVSVHVGVKVGDREGGSQPLNQWDIYWSVTILSIHTKSAFVVKFFFKLDLVYGFFKKGWVQC